MPAPHAAAADPAARATVAAAVASALMRFAQEPGGLLPALHHIQDALGHVPGEAVADLATAFNLSRAEVHGVITYYHHFRTHPPGRHVVQICRAEACQAMGADALLKHAGRRLGCSAPHEPHGRSQMTTAAGSGGASGATPGEAASLGGHSPDGRYTLEPVYCLGLCASSPAALVGERLYARLTPEKFDRIVDMLENAP